MISRTTHPNYDRERPRLRVHPDAHELVARTLGQQPRDAVLSDDHDQAKGGDDDGVERSGD